VISFFPLLLDMIPLPLGAIYPVLIVIAFEVIMGYAWANNASSLYRLGWLDEFNISSSHPSFAYRCLRILKTKFSMGLLVKSQ
jgi:hypothetical protein